jgi:hypothetical protein
MRLVLYSFFGALLTEVALLNVEEDFDLCLFSDRLDIAFCT